ncbi:MAG: serine protease [Oscillospiraceae bacterium]|nr:serine protease [Oscillospiraceae bacterium]
MANRNEILNRMNEFKNAGQDLIRREYLKDLYEYTGHDTIVYAAAFPCNIPGVSGSSLSIGLGDIQGFMTCLNGLHGDTLDLIIHSPGGSLEATEQLVQYLRAKYKYIRAIVPQNAMSAATMLACACDEIVMGKQSAIGPIDPQMTLTRPNGVGYSLPAHSILADFERAKVEIAKDRNAASVWVPKLLEIPNGFLDLCTKTIELSKSKVAEWLDAYMFKDDKVKKGKEIAGWLGDFNEHKTHGRPINYQLAADKGLKVKLLEDDQNLQEKVLSVFHATLVTFDVTPCVKIVENHLGKGSYVVVQQQIIPTVK